MPTLDDAPTVQIAALTGLEAGTSSDSASRAHANDFIQIYDASEGVAKKIKLSELAIALQATLDT